MKVDECSAMGCPENAGDDREIIHMIRATADGTPLVDNGVNLSFCPEHGEHFLREWAGLMTMTDETDKRIHVITALNEDQHRALLSRGISAAIDAYLT